MYKSQFKLKIIAK